MEKTLDRVRELFSEAGQISDPALREKVLKAWLEAWKASHYEQLEETPFLRGILTDINNVEHTKAVTAMCIQFAKIMKDFFHISVNMDYLIAGAILHDLGKVFEYCEKPSELGRLFTHPISAVYFAAREDLPLEVIHLIGSHSLEGNLIQRTTEAAIIHYMDFACAEVTLRAKTNTSLGELARFLVIQKR